MRFFRIFTNPLTGPIITAVIVSSIIFFYYIPTMSADNKKYQIKKDAENLASHIMTFRSYYSSNIVSKVRANTTLNIDHNYKDNQTTIPPQIVKTTFLKILFS